VRTLLAATALSCLRLPFSSSVLRPSGSYFDPIDLACRRKTTLLWFRISHVVAHWCQCMFACSSPKTDWKTSFILWIAACPPVASGQEHECPLEDRHTDISPIFYGSLPIYPQLSRIDNASEWLVTSSLVWPLHSVSLLYNSPFFTLPPSRYL
jgi:hypothetical protein